MNTEYLSVKDAGSEVALQRAADIISSGGLVAIPTETVYGLGASALIDEAVAKIFEVKGRPQDNPLIIHVHGAEALEKWCSEVPEEAYTLAEKFWPGPLTMVLKKKPCVPDRVTAGMDTVGVRCPDHPATLRIIELAGVPIAAPSANISGKPSPTTAQHVRHDIDGMVEAIVDGGDCRVGLESTIIDLSVSPPRLLRPGGVSIEQLREVLGEVSVDAAVYRKLEAGEQPKAPGMKYRHYSPRAKVTILDGTADNVAAYVNANCGPRTAVLCFDGEEALFNAPVCLSYGDPEKPETLAEKLFACLRELDREDIDEIYSRCPPKDGVGLAVYNRLSKAAGNTVIEV
ncbi:MAG: threonylcarbamoyl-AMP synthase [Oscillospiraceae bacterium]|nr:threonylcarbamoyl-AMP synthase [Oscillospiraceae bacterium]